jgi:hypothetical protein
VRPVLEDVVDEGLRKKNDNLPLFELAFNVTPDDVVINEAVVCKISHNILTFLVTWQFLI